MQRGVVIMTANTIEPQRVDGNQYRCMRYLTCTWVFEGILERNASSFAAFLKAWP